MRPPPKLCIPETAALLVCVLLGLLLRWGVCLRDWNDRSDPDVYMALAQEVRSGRGYSTPGTGVPTAFRPPLYPLLLAFTGGDLPGPRCLLHLALAGTMLLLIWHTAGNLGLGLRGQCAATLLAAIDPLLLRYASLPMTETLAATLSAALLWQCSTPRFQDSKQSAALGTTFGLAMLCRPTFWIFGGLLATLAVVWAVRRLRRISSESNEDSPAIRFVSIHHWGIAAACCAVIIGPWALRNWAVLGTPVIMTTHGGYTLALGNNPAFYDEVVRQPWGTIWDGSHGGGQPAWAHDIVAAMDRLHLTTEVQQDQWLQQQAWSAIRERPVDFLKACALKFTWFWNVGPHAEATQSVPPSLTVTIKAYYCTLWMVLLPGVWRVLRKFQIQRSTVRAEEPVSRPASGLWGWCAVLALVASFTAMHLVYWSDARMRAPIVPAIALLCAAAVCEKSAAKNADSRHA